MGQSGSLLDLESRCRQFESDRLDVRDKLLGRKSNWNWGRNSRREIRYIEKRETEADIFDEISQEKEDQEREEANKKYKEYLENHWVNRLIATKQKN